MPKSSPPIETVARVLEGYASRGVFRGFSRLQVANKTASFKILWHRERVFDLILDLGRATMRIPVVLPEVPARSVMYRDFKEFLQARFSADLPAHRRIDPRRVQMRCANRAHSVSLTATVVDGDYEYATRKLIHVVHEIFLDFLASGAYYEYMLQAFDLDPDRP